MENTINEPLQCNYCQNSTNENQKYCVSCGYPQRGTAGEKSKFHSERILSNSKTKEAPRLIKRARNILFIIAVINLLYGIYLFVRNGDTEILIAGSILAIIYIVLAFWTQKRPLIALILALLLYITMIVLGGVVDSSTIVRGLLLKGFVIYFLAKGINSAMHLRTTKKQK